MCKKLNKTQKNRIENETNKKNEKIKANQGEPPKKRLLAPDPLLDLDKYSPKTGKILRIIGHVLLFIFIVILFVCSTPLFESVLFPETFLSKFDALLWHKKPKSNVELVRFLDVNLHDEDVVFNIKLYKASQMPLHKIKQVIFYIDTGEIPYTNVEFVLCRPSPDIQPSFQNYVKIAKLCYLYIRQIIWNAQIKGYGHGIGANILISAANSLWKEHCYSFDRIIINEPIISVEKVIRNKLYYFPFVNIIEKNIFRILDLEKQQFIRDAKEIYSKIDDISKASEDSHYLEQELKSYGKYTRIANFDFGVQILSKCFTNKETNSCLSNVCYSHFYIHQEGFLEGYDCNPTSSLPYSDCIRILENSSMGTSLCVIKNENERHCCCLSTESESMCAAENRNTQEFFDLWNGLQVLYFFMAILMTTLIASFANTFYDYAYNKWSEENSDFSENNTIYVIFISRITILFVISLLLNIPFTMDCSIHENGRFFNPRTFLYTKFSDNMLNSVYFTINFVFCYFEYELWKKYTSSKKINRTAAITISLFIFLTIPLIIIQPIRETYQLFEKEKEAYCKLGYVLHILNFCHFLYILYDIIVLIHIREIFKLDEEFMIESSKIEEVFENNLLSIEKSASTAETNSISTENILEFEPRPFDVSRNSTSILKIKSNSKCQWIALRALLSTTGFYKIHPTKFIIPPGREISIEVSQISQNKKSEAAFQHNILIEWFFIGSVPPAIEVNKFWIRPYIVPQSNWNIFVLPIYLESET